MIHMTISFRSGYIHVTNQLVIIYYQTNTCVQFEYEYKI